MSELHFNSDSLCFISRMAFLCTRKSTTQKVIKLQEIFIFLRCQQHKLLFLTLLCKELLVSQPHYTLIISAYFSGRESLLYTCLKFRCQTPFRGRQ